MANNRGRSRVLQSVVRGPRRATEWISSAIVSDFATLAAAASVLHQSLAFLEPATVVRTRGTLWVESDQVAATEFPFGAMGMVVVKNAAAAAGVASVPTPVTEQNDDGWFVWTPFASAFKFVTASGFSPQGWSRFDFDSKAQRKVVDGDTIVVVLENSSGTDGLHFLIQFRMLVMLHG